MNHHARETYLTTADVARIAGVTPAAVRALSNRGRLEVATVTAGGIRLYTLATAQRYAEERETRRQRCSR